MLCEVYGKLQRNSSFVFLEIISGVLLGPSKGRMLYQEASSSHVSGTAHDELRSLEPIGHRGRPVAFIIG